MRFVQSATDSYAPRYAWVLAGPHVSDLPTTEPGPRAEFEVFLRDFGGVLISRSDLNQDLPPVSRALKRAGRLSMGLASLVQSRAHEFDAIIASGEDIGVPIALASIAHGSRVPIHMMFHGHHLQSRKLRMLGPVLRQLTHVHFHCLSQSLADRTQAILGIQTDRCHATGYGVDTSYFADGLAPATALIASAGAANRDYATLAAAVQDLPAEVRIAADSTWVPPVTEIGTDGWPSNIDMRSYGTYARLRDLYGKAQLVVVPLHPAQHACGYAVMAEAMAMGRAVIATRTDAPPDFLIPGTTGLFTEAYDVQGLRSTICRLLRNPHEAAEIGRNARALMLQTYSLEHFCRRLNGIVEASMIHSPNVITKRSTRSAAE